MVPPAASLRSGCHRGQGMQGRVPGNKSGPGSGARVGQLRGGKLQHMRQAKFLAEAGGCILLLLDAYLHAECSTLLLNGLAVGGTRIGMGRYSCNVSLC